MVLLVDVSTVLLLILMSCFETLGSTVNVPSIRPHGARRQLKPDTNNGNVMSVVLDDKAIPSFVRFLQPPSIIGDGSQITTEYQCIHPNIIGVQLHIRTFTNHDVIVFRHWWRCGEDNSPKQTIVTLKLPDRLAYRPSHFNKWSLVVESATLMAFVMDYSLFKGMRKKIDVFPVAPIKVAQDVQFTNPFDRPGKPSTICLTWFMAIIMGKPFTPMCPLEAEVYSGISFPVALSGHFHGVHRMLLEYINPVLRKERTQSFKSPTFTVSLWLYIVEYCTEGRQLCSIMQRITWEEFYCTPLFYINTKGQIHVQAVGEDGRTTAFLTGLDFIVPKLQWCHLVFTVNDRKWKITKKCDRAWTKIEPKDSTHYTFPMGLWYDDTQCLTVFGGTEIAAAFKGYIGEAKIYRRRALNIDQLPRKHVHDRIFELGLSEWGTKCRRYLSWVDYVEYRVNKLKQEIIDRKSCQDDIYELFYPDSVWDAKTCNVYTGPIPRQYHLAYTILRRWVIQGRKYTHLDIGQELMKSITHIIEEQGLLGIAGIVPLLRQASCYGDHDATFMLATILNNGMGVKADENQAHKYLMYGALEGNELCLLALGIKHMYGIDGIPQDYEQAYAYYKKVADITKQDKEDHKRTGVYTEHVRLTDEEAVKAQTDEDGDVFHWFRHQAQQGVVSAQREMARMLYWGARGISRNTDAAVDYYRMAAQMEDPTALYDYGIVLLKGHGVEKNISAAVEFFEKSAEHGNHMALNVLGWHALEIERNTTKAVHYLEKSYKLGNVDAAHNLGYMMVSGKYPGKKRDRIAALKYYNFAALRGSIDSGVVIGMYNIRGGGVNRNPALASSWLRYISEQNMALGHVLRRGLRAYRNHNWPAALVYYHMAAETGLEVGTFNTAYLCDENDDGLVHYLEKECTWRFFNLSTLREEHHVNPYAWIKMGDYYWYGCEGVRDPVKASNYYSQAAKRGDPHALFNLGFMLEEGAEIPQYIWRDLRLSANLSNTEEILIQIYSRCRESHKTEAFVPCSVALYKLQASMFWNRYQILVKLSSMLGGILGTLMAVAWMASYFRSQRQTVSNI